MIAGSRADKWTAIPARAVIAFRYLDITERTNKRTKAAAKRFPNHSIGNTPLAIYLSSKPLCFDSLILIYRLPTKTYSMIKLNLVSSYADFKRVHVRLLGKFQQTNWLWLSFQVTLRKR